MYDGLFATFCGVDTICDIFMIVVYISSMKKITELLFDPNQKAHRNFSFIITYSIGLIMSIRIIRDIVFGVFWFLGLISMTDQNNFAKFILEWYHIKLASDMFLILKNSISFILGVLMLSILYLFGI